MTSSRFNMQDQTAFLSAMTPGFVSFEDLNNHINYFVTSKSYYLPNRFDNRAIFDTEVYRTEILSNVDAVLKQYAAGVPAYPKSDEHIQKSLLWSALQLYARIQAIEADVGVVLERGLEWDQRIKQLSQCKELLSQTTFDTSALDTLISVLPIMPKVVIQQCQNDEAWFQWVIDNIDRLNDKRLFWVWGKATEDLGLDVLSATDAQQRLSDSTYIPSQLSWSLYLLRGGIFFREYLKKRCEDPAWLETLEPLSPEDRQRYIADYQKAWWDIYKYRILNDFVWGPINLASFAWWVGDGFYGWLGDAATVFLLCMDAYLSDLAYQEAEEHYLKNEDNYKQKEQSLREKLLELYNQGMNMPVDDFDTIQVNIQNQPTFAHLRSMLADWKNVRDGQVNAEQQWLKKQAALYYDCIYTKSLLIAFTMSVALLMPGALPIFAVVCLQTSGTILCTALTIVQRTAKVRLDVSHQETEIAQLKQQESDYLTEFNAEKTKNPDGFDDIRMKELYRQIQSLGAELNYKDKMVYYQHIELARTTLLRFLVPALIGLTLIYAPAAVFTIPTYVFTLALSALLAYALAQLTESQKPSELKNVVFEESGYQTFFANPKVSSQPRTCLLYNEVGWAVRPNMSGP